MERNQLVIEALREMVPADLDQICVNVEAANVIQRMTMENERLRKALEIAGKRLYKEGAPHSYVDDVNRVLDGEEVEYYD